MHGAAEFPPIVALTKEERLIYCDERFFKLMVHLMICDSNSYQFVYNPDGKMAMREQEFKDSSKWMQQDWDEKYKLLKHHMGGKHGCC